MIRRFLPILFLLSSGIVFAQTDSLIFSENFNTACVVSGPISTQLTDSSWIEYNIPESESFAWNCTQNLGRWGTPGMNCTGDITGTYYLDSSWIFTPPLQLNGFLDTVYLFFDSKFSVDAPSGDHKAKLNILIYKVPTTDTLPALSRSFIDSNTVDMGAGVAPVIGPPDSVGWVTHSVKLTPYLSIYYPYVRIAFRYISSDTLAGKWFIDNINVRAIPLGVPTISGNHPDIYVSGYNSNQRTIIQYATRQPGNYDLEILNATGQTLFKRQLTTNGSRQSLELDDLALQPGLYIVRMTGKNAQTISRFAAY